MKILHPQTKLIAFLAAACLASASVALAVEPPPDGGYPGKNTAEGEDALFSLTSGRSNTAVGSDALYSNTTGGGNTATGYFALSSNEYGSSNTANGFEALLNNVGGYNNSAIGSQALRNSTEGYSNTAVGLNALLLNGVGNNNTAADVASLYNNTGNNNIAIGYKAGINLTTGSNNIDIGSRGVSGESNTIRIGATGTQTNTYIDGITGVTVAGGVGVIIDSNGHLGTVVSSVRFKDAIKPMDKASEAILGLQPVTFRYKHELDPDGIPQFGLVAEDVAKVDRDLVARDEEGKPYTVRYEAVNAMLLNEFLKEHRKVEELEATVTQLQAALKAQAAQIQKVSDQLRTQASATRVVAKD